MLAEVNQEIFMGHALCFSNKLDWWPVFDNRKLATPYQQKISKFHKK
jgi:hypothetical protein